MQQSKYRIHIATLLGFNSQIVDIIPFGNRNIVLTFMLLVLFIGLSIPFSILFQNALGYWSILFLVLQVSLYLIELMIFRKFTELFTKGNKNKYLYILAFSLIGLLIYLPTVIVLPNSDCINEVNSLSFVQFLELSQKGKWLSVPIISFIAIISLLPFHLIEAGLKLYPIIIQFNENINTAQ